jgi:cytochrome c peroxidase
MQYSKPNKTGKMKLLRYILIVSLMGPLFISQQTAFSDNDLLQKAQQLFKPIPVAPPAIKGNPASPVKIHLGQTLYFDPRLSASNLISCNTCHNVGLAGADLQETSVGHAWQKGARNAPTVFNAIFNIAQFWDGRARDLAEQAKSPVQASVEMNNTPERALATLKSMPEYEALFKKAFPRESDPLNFNNLVKAIEVFEATLLTPDSPFDRFLKGDKNALNPDERNGLELFIEKGCAECHGGINVGGSDYYPFGVVEEPYAENMEVRPQDDTGRFRLTFDPDDVFVFRSPPLRNVAFTPPYFHSGRVWKLEDSVSLMSDVQLGIKLNSMETKLISEFLQTLTGEQPLIKYPILPPNQESTPRPSLAKPTPKQFREY